MHDYRGENTFNTTVDDILHCSALTQLYYAYLDQQSPADRIQTKVSSKVMTGARDCDPQLLAIAKRILSEHSSASLFGSPGVNVTGCANLRQLYDRQSLAVVFQKSMNEMTNYQTSKHQLMQVIQKSMKSSEPPSLASAPLGGLETVHFLTKDLGPSKNKDLYLGYLAHMFSTHKIPKPAAGDILRKDPRATVILTVRKPPASKPAVILAVPKPPKVVGVLFVRNETDFLRQICGVYAFDPYHEVTILMELVRHAQGMKVISLPLLDSQPNDGLLDSDQLILYHNIYR